MYNSIKLPVFFAFEEMRDWLNDRPALLVFDVFSQLIYLIDIFIILRTSYIETHTGDEIFDPKMIAVNYITKGSFIIDVLANTALLNYMLSLPSSKNATARFFAQFFEFFAYLKIF